MKKGKKIIKRLFVAFLILAALALITLLLTNLWMYSSVKDRIYNREEINDLSSFEQFDGEEPDCIIVLGCGVNADGIPTPLLSDRLDAAIELYNKGVAPKILMSGDHGKNDYDEVNAMRQYAVSAGVPSEDIFMDHAGFSTYETMYRAKAIFGITRAVVVTQEYHLTRSLYNAKAMGIDACGVIATGHVFAAQPYYSAREILARTKDFFWCIIKPEPTFLGETVDIKGSGEITFG